MYRRARPYFASPADGNQEPGSLLEQATIIDEMAKDADTFGVAWNQTSANSSTWQVVDHYERDGESACRRYNIFVDKDHKFVFANDQKLCQHIIASEGPLKKALRSVRIRLENEAPTREFLRKHRWL